MKFRPRLTKNTLIFGGAAAWGLLLVSCVTANRTILAPPFVAGAQFVGSKDCAECHEDITSGFHDATHARLVASGEVDKNIGCESCHGPGSEHAKTGGAAGTILNPARNPETCYQCHTDKRAEFQLVNSHPVAHGQMACNDCHESHKAESQLSSPTASCLQCHDAQRGPYVFEHEALREDCTSCHNPHGTVNAKMLKTTSASLCLQCHHQQQTSTGLMIGGRDHAAFLSRGTCWIAGCHEAVHGSHVSSSLRF